MKKIMSIMLGLTLILGTTVFAADEKPKEETKKTTKKKGGKKKADKSTDAKPMETK